MSVPQTNLEPDGVLVLTAGVGAGHNEAGKAVVEALRTARGDLPVHQVDVLDHVTKAFRLWYAGGYALSVTRLAPLYGVGFRLTDRPNGPQRGLGERIRLWNEYRNLRHELLPMIQRLRPRLIVHTHFLAPSAVGVQIRRGELSTRQYVVVTDMEIHRWWYSTEVDHWFLPTDQACERVKQWGVDPDRMTVSGIPIRPKWKLPHDRRQILKDWDLADAREIVLLSGGADFTCGPVVRIARGILQSCPQATVCVLAGRNKKLLEQLGRLAANERRLRPLGFTDRLPELAEVASLIITKAGGLTTSECLSKALPMVLLKPVPGQEAANARYFRDQGAALTAHSPAEVVAQVRQLLDNRADLAMMSANARRLYRDSTGIIAERLLRILDSADSA